MRKASSRLVTMPTRVLRCRSDGSERRTLAHARCNAMGTERGITGARSNFARLQFPLALVQKYAIRCHVETQRHQTGRE